MWVNSVVLFHHIFLSKVFWWFLSFTFWIIHVHANIVKGNYGAIVFFSFNLLLYNFARKSVRLPKIGGASKETQYLPFVTLHVRFYSWVEGLYNHFFTEHFRPKLEVNKLASWSHCPIFFFTIFVYTYEQLLIICIF